MSTNSEKLIETVRNSIIGDDIVIEGPYGPRRVTYADYTTALAMLERTGQLEKYEDAINRGNIFALKATSTVKEGIKQLQYDLLPDYGIKAVSIENAVGKEEVIQKLLNNSINIDKASQNYLEGRPQNNNPLINE